ncbi:intradiol ring-cleavage dioxygenase [Naumannella halotolerans]|uniref:Dioxygenase-like protein n=1 Tax=Naumannella halotolerans TaxID=993414 RepID=A0A4R7J968_9ACTN|nr:intradiol ring-cleavage dioxygenase [Naumannella halotolerans]TDT33406.1 dioxygenase-like protein [Naumannella halotolerans]
MNKPRPYDTPEGPAYQGRLLPDPTEEVVDQGLRFDLGTLFSRRRMLAVLGAGAGTAALAACGAAASDTTSSDATTSSSELTEIPDETNGPYPADGSNGPDVLEMDGIIRSDIRSSFGDASGTAEGVPFTFELTVLDMVNENAPMVGAAVYVWHCDRNGDYSMYTESIEDENYLRGVQITDDEGKVNFTAIFPACYTGRWPHVHFEVYPDEASMTDYDARLSTSQMALPQDICDTVYATTGYEQSVTNMSQLTLETDNVFGDDGGVNQLATVTGDLDAGYHASLQVPIDTGTEPTAGEMGGEGGPGAGGEGGPGGGGEPPSGGGEPPSGEPPSGGGPGAEASAEES